MAEAILDNEPGVYAIHNTHNGRFYIGRTSNLSRRFREHFKQLADGNHINPGLQADWNKHGGHTFRMEVLVRATADECAGIEAHLIAERGGADCYNIAETSIAPKRGRKAIDPSGECMGIHPVRMTDAEWERCKELGGASWIRQMIAEKTLANG